jgi:hypothetical protein
LKKNATPAPSAISRSSRTHSGRTGRWRARPLATCRHEDDPQVAVHLRALSRGRRIALLATSRCVAKRGSRLAFVLGRLWKAGTAMWLPVPRAAPRPPPPHQARHHLARPARRGVGARAKLRSGIATIRWTVVYDPPTALVARGSIVR